MSTTAIVFLPHTPLSDARGQVASLPDLPPFLMRTVCSTRDATTNYRPEIQSAARTLLKIDTTPPAEPPERAGIAAYEGLGLSSAPGGFHHLPKYLVYWINRVGRVVVCHTGPHPTRDWAIFCLMGDDGRTKYDRQLEEELLLLSSIVHATAVIAEEIVAERAASNPPPEGNPFSRSTPPLYPCRP